MALRQNQLLPDDLVTCPADYVRSVYQIKVPAKFSFDALLSPEIWKNIEHLRPGDMVTVISESGAFDADLRVLSSDR
jgi:hypothetical protein